MQNMSAERHDNNSEVNQVKIFIQKLHRLWKTTRMMTDTMLPGNPPWKSEALKKKTGKSEACEKTLEK